jgi:hypothetical protein
LGLWMGGVVFYSFFREWSWLCLLPWKFAVCSGCLDPNTNPVVIEMSLYLA